LESFKSVEFLVVKVALAWMSRIGGKISAQDFKASY